MSKESKSGTSAGIGFTGLLTIVFITLKLLNVIQWSWVWVLSPIWISAALFVILSVCMCFVPVIFAIKSNKNKKK